MYSYKGTQESTSHPTKLAFHSLMRPEFDLLSNYGHNFKKTDSFVDIVHFTDRANIVTYVAIWNFFAVSLSTLKILQSEQDNREKRKIFSLCKKPKCIPNNDHHNCSIHKEHTSSIFKNPYNLWDKNSAVLKTLKSALCFILIHDAVKSK